MNWMMNLVRRNKWKFFPSIFISFPESWDHLWSQFHLFFQVGHYKTENALSILSTLHSHIIPPYLYWMDFLFYFFGCYRLFSYCCRYLLASATFLLDSFFEFHFLLLFFSFLIAWACHFRVARLHWRFHMTCYIDSLPIESNWNSLAGFTCQFSFALVIFIPLIQFYMIYRKCRVHCNISPVIKITRQPAPTYRRTRTGRDARINFGPVLIVFRHPLSFSLCSLFTPIQKIAGSVDRHLIDFSLISQPFVVSSGGCLRVRQSTRVYVCF